MTVEEGGPFIPIEPGPWKIETAMDEEGNVHFKSFFEDGWFNLQSSRGELVMRPQGNPENFLRVWYAWRLAEVGAILVHASGLIKNGLGYCFFGASGSGKTTITRLSGGTLILSDDLVVVKCGETSKDAPVILFGVPFRGELVEGPRINAFAPDAVKGKPEEIVKWATEEMKYTAQAAKKMGCSVVTGFMGSPIWAFWYSFPPTTEEMIENGFQQIRKLWTPILDEFDKQGVKFALEPHPEGVFSERTGNLWV